MKVLQINCVYQQGSTGKIVADIHRDLQSQGIESVVCYGRGQRSTEKHVYKTCWELAGKANNFLSRFTGRPYAVAPIATARLLQRIKSEKPDVVHLHCLNGFFVNIYALMNYLKKNKIPTVLTLHAEFMYTGNCSHALDCDNWKIGCKTCPDVFRAIQSYGVAETGWNWQSMKKAFDGFENLQICPVSDWVRGRAEQSPILNQYPMKTVLNGIDTDTFRYNPDAALRLRKRMGWENKKIILHVTANYQDPIKGGQYITELSNQFDSEGYVVVVADGADGQAPEDFRGVYWGRTKSQQELAALYSAADVTVITSQRETFSLVCAEGLCCGTPVVGFRAGGPESIALEDYCSFTEFGDLQQLATEIHNMISLSCSHETLAENAADVYGNRRMIRQYEDIYQENR